jgi:Antibiotic biosynthesis monooxygenase
MFVHIAIHRPRPGQEQPLIDSMHRFGAAARAQPGLREVHTLRDANSGVLVGLAIWDTKEAWLAARPVMWEAVKDDNFDDWEDTPPEVYQLEGV